MLNVLIADDNINYVKNLINLVIGKNSSIKITNIASNGFEVLDILQKNNKIDLILLDLKMPKLDGIQTLNTLSNIKLNKYPNIFVISGETKMITKVIDHPLVTDYINKSNEMIEIYDRLKIFEQQMEYLNIKDNLSKKITAELIHIGYNPSHIGTQYIRECILEIYKSANLINNLENYVYKKVACSYSKSLQNIKSNIIKATNFMYAESDILLLKTYFNFYDNIRKPTPKMVISTILNKL